MNDSRVRSFLLSPWPWLGAAVVLVAVVLWRNANEPAVRGDPRPVGDADEIEALASRDDLNLLFVLIDTLRADHLHTYGYHRPTSPLFDVLAGQGVLFANHMSASSWTKCSMASLWTGMHPERAGVTRFDEVISPEARMPAEIFREAGFRTAGMWRNGWVEGYFGFDQGFEVYARPGHRPVPEQIQRKNPTVNFGGTDFDLVSAASEFLRAHGHERWFLYLHMMDVHEYTYDVETARFGSRYVDAYDNSILHVNQVVDRLLGELTLTGHLDDTVVVITADHGEAFGERQSEGHARDVYPETTRIPLLLNFPFRLEQGVRIRHRTANVDVWPTLLDLFGLPALENADGRSRLPELLAALRHEPPPPDDSVSIAHLDQTWGQRVDTTSPTVAVRRANHRYVVFRNTEGKTIREELFDANADPKEQTDILADEPELAQELRAIAEDYLASKPPWEDETDRLELDEIQLNQLRALGYQVP